MNKYYLLVVLLLVSLTLVGVASNYPTGAWIGYNADTGKFIPVAVDASGTVLVEGIGGASESAIKAQVDTINEESGGSTLTDSLDLVDSNYTNIKAALASTGVDMTGVKPSGYDAKIADCARNSRLHFNPATKSLVIYGYNSWGTGGQSLIVPADIAGVAVENINDYFFPPASIGNPPKITNLQLSEGLKTIGVNAFSSNAISNDLTIPSTVTAIGEAAFIQAITASKLTILGAATLGKQAFRECFSLAELDIQNVVSIDILCFYLDPIIKIKIGANVTISENPPYPTMGVYGDAFVALYNGNGKLAGTYEYAAGSWSKTS